MYVQRPPHINACIVTLCTSQHTQAVVQSESSFGVDTSKHFLLPISFNSTPPPHFPMALPFHATHNQCIWCMSSKIQGGPFELASVVAFNGAFLEFCFYYLIMRVCIGQSCYASICFHIPFFGSGFWKCFPFSISMRKAWRCSMATSVSWLV